MKAASTCIIPIPKYKIKITKMSSFLSTIKSWNSLIPHCHEAASKTHFSKLLVNLFSMNKALFVGNVARSIQITFTQDFQIYNLIFIEKHCVDSADCECGHNKENYMSVEDHLNIFKSIFDIIFESNRLT